MEKPLMRVVGELYRFDWPDLGIQAELDRINETRSELTGELTVVSNRPESPGLLHSARLNLMSTQARTTLAKMLSTRIPETVIDWTGLLEQLTFLAVRRYRDGEPSVDLRAVKASDTQRWLVYPYVELGGPSILFAKGGSGKSVLAMAVAITAAQSEVAVCGRLMSQPAPVLYLDWETNAETHAERLRALCGAAGIRNLPPVYYRRQFASLHEAQGTIRREVARLHAGLVIVDSAGAAGDGPPEEASTAIRLFQAIRSFEVPTLLVHHKTKNKQIGGDETQPFGSAYYHNLARLTWDLEAVSQEGQPELVVALTNRKSNNGQLVPRHAYRLRFQMEGSGDNQRLAGIRISRCDMAEVPELASKMSLADRILAELRGGPMQAKEIAESLEADLPTVKSRLTELKSRGKVVNIQAGWALAAADPRG